MSTPPPVDHDQPVAAGDDTGAVVQDQPTDAAPADVADGAGVPPVTADSGSGDDASDAVRTAVAGAGDVDAELDALVASGDVQLHESDAGRPLASSLRGLVALATTSSAFAPVTALTNRPTNFNEKERIQRHNYSNQNYRLLF